MGITASSTSPLLFQSRNIQHTRLLKLQDLQTALDSAAYAMTHTLAPAAITVLALRFSTNCPVSTESIG